MSLKQKTIGMIGGTSWESTVLYYKLINQAVREKLGQLHSAKLILHSVNYAPIIALEQEGKWDEIGRLLGNAASGLQTSGAAFVMLCCNTLHKAAPAIEHAITIPFLHIADAAGSKVSQHNIQKIGLLGTQFTMEDGFYAARLMEKFGLEVMVPELTARKRIDTIIYDELCQGKIQVNSKRELVGMIQGLEHAGAEAVLLGCTELGMLITAQDVRIPVYDTALLHAEEAVRVALN